MSDKTRHTESALQVWASTVMSGAEAADPDQVGEVDRHRATRVMTRPTSSPCS